MPQPVVYYVRHGETDWNVEGRLQGRHDIPLNGTGRRQAVACGEILRDLFACTGRAPAALDYVSSPLQRARVTMDLMREVLGLPPGGYRIEDRLAEISFGAWEGFTLSELAMHDREAVARRDQDKWHFLPPGGESYAQLMVRVRDWYTGLSRDTVVAAHGGTARALFAHLGFVATDAAALQSIEQGVVYVLADGSWTLYS
jgi:broad specificity phosphatase PhoE